MKNKPRLGFDLDETLGVPILQGNDMIGFQARQGCFSLLEKLGMEFDLCLWSVSNRRYVDKALSFGLGKYFSETLSWDEMPVSWKDVCRLDLAYLIDDSDHHREAAKERGIAHR